MTRNTRQFLILPVASAFFLMTVLAGCSKSSSKSSSALSGTFGGKAYSPSQTLSIDIAAQSTIGILGIQVQNGDSVALSIAIPDNTATGTTNWTSNDEVDIEYYDSKGTFDFESFVPGSHGTLVLTTFDHTNKKIAGTFSGVLYGFNNPSDSIVVTNGSFNMTYIVE